MMSLAGRDTGGGGEPDFRELLSEARRNSSDAVGELLERCREFLSLLAETSLDADLRRKVSASDLVQESLIEAQRDFQNFRGRNETELRSWLKRILVNNLLNQYRDWKKTQKRQFSREISLTEVGVGEHPIADPSLHSPSAIASRREQAELLRQAIDRLPDDYRQVIELRNREHLEFDAIGRAMKRSPDAARMLWYRAFERLAEEMGQPR